MFNQNFNIAGGVMQIYRLVIAMDSFCLGSQLAAAKPAKSTGLQYVESAKANTSMLKVGVSSSKALVRCCRFRSSLSHPRRVSGRVCDRHDGSGGRLFWGSVRSGLSTFGQRSHGKFTRCTPHCVCVCVFCLK